MRTREERRGGEGVEVHGEGGGAERCRFCYCAHHWNPGPVCFMVFKVTPLHTHAHTQMERGSYLLVPNLLIYCHYWCRDQTFIGTRWISSAGNEVSPGTLTAQCK